MHYDVVIIGAGPAGLSFACSLKQSDLRVLVVEQASEESLREPVEDGREIALTHQSVELMSNSGAWQKLAAENIAPICAARVVDGDSDYSLSFDNRRQDLDALGYLVPNHAIRQAYYDVAFDASDQQKITLLTGTSVTDLGSCEDHAWVVLSDGKRVQCGLLVSADSRFSETRRKMGIAATMNDFSRSAIVCRMTHSGDHEQTAIECFHYGRTLALLPMGGNRSSIVVTVGSEEAEAIYKMPDTEFEADIEQRLKGQLGTMKLCGQRHLYPLVGVHAKRFIAQRFAVIGDAAVGMHPVTAHGFNLGLKSQETLAKVVMRAAEKSQDIGAARLLAIYQRKHMLATRPIYHGTNLVVGLFTDDRIPAKLARKLTMRLANNCAPLKQVITAKLTEKGLPSLNTRLPDLPSLPGWLPRF